MKQGKMRKIITACVSAATVLFVILFAFLIYQWIKMAVLDKRIEKVQEEIAYYEELNENAEGTAEWLESEQGKLWTSWQYGFIQGQGE